VAYSKNGEWSSNRNTKLVEFDQYDLTNSFAYWKDRRSGRHMWGILDAHGKMVGHGSSSGASYVINRIFLTNIVKKYVIEKKRDRVKIFIVEWMRKSYRIKWPKNFGRCWMEKWLTGEQQTDDWMLVQDQDNTDGFSIIEIPEKYRGEQSIEVAKGANLPKRGPVRALNLLMKHDLGQAIVVSNKLVGELVDKVTLPLILQRARAVHHQLEDKIVKVLVALGQKV